MKSVRFKRYISNIVWDKFKSYSTVCVPIWQFNQLLITEQKNDWLDYIGIKFKFRLSDKGLSV